MELEINGVPIRLGIVSGSRGEVSIIKVTSEDLSSASQSRPLGTVADAVRAIADFTNVSINAICEAQVATVLTRAGALPMQPSVKRRPTLISKLRPPTAAQRAGPRSISAI